MVKISEFQDVCVSMISKNEEGAVAGVIKEIKKHLPGAEILIVDSSEDRTAEIAKDHGAIVIKQYPPKGYGPAMGKALLSPEKDIIITMDCDGTYPTTSLPDLVELIHRGYDLVGTSRISRRKPEHMPLANYLANKMFNVIASIVFLRRIKDVHSGMRAYRCSLLHDVKWHINASALPVELILKPIRKKYKVKEIPIDYRPRIGRTTLDRWNSTVWTLKRIFKCRFGKEE